MLDQMFAVVASFELSFGARFRDLHDQEAVLRISSESTKGETVEICSTNLWTRRFHGHELLWPSCP